MAGILQWHTTLYRWPSKPLYLTKVIGELSSALRLLRLTLPEGFLMQIVFL